MSEDALLSVLVGLLSVVALSLAFAVRRLRRVIADLDALSAALRSPEEPSS